MNDDKTDLYSRVMADAGLTDVGVEEIAWKFELRSGDDLWTVVTKSNPIGGEMVAGLTEKQKAAVLQMLDELLAERAGGSGPAVLTYAVNVASERAETIRTNE